MPRCGALSSLRHLSQWYLIYFIFRFAMAARCSLLRQRPFSSTMSRILPATMIGKGAGATLCNTRFGSSRVPCSAPDGITGQVCQWIDSVQLSDIPSNVQTKVKYLVLDGLACAIVGAKLPWSKVAKKAVLDIEGPGKCTVFGWDQVRATFTSP